MTTLTPPEPAFPARRYHRWTDDTRTAFVLALRLYGTVEGASAAIGRMTGVVYDQRAKHPAFAAAWDAALADRAAAEREARDAVSGSQALAGPLGGGAVTDPSLIVIDGRKRRERWDGFTPLRRRHFLRVLAETGEVKRACRAVRVTEGAAHRYREEDADFAAAWDRALASSAPTLEQIAYERAVHGWDEPVFAGGKQVGTRRRYSEPLLRQLLVKQDKAKAIADDPRALLAQAHEAAEAAGGFFSTPVERDETNAAIVHQLAMIEKRLAGERRREAERLLVEGRVP